MTIKSLTGIRKTSQQLNNFFFRRSISYIAFSSTLVSAFIPVRPITRIPIYKSREATFGPSFSHNLQPTTFSFSMVKRDSYQTMEDNNIQKKQNGHTSKKPKVRRSSTNKNGRVNNRNKSRTKELETLSKTMGVGIPQVMDLLKKRRCKEEHGSEKAEYIDWILKSETTSGINGDNTRKNDSQNIDSQQFNNDSTDRKKNGRKGPARPRRPDSVEKKEEENIAVAESRYAEALQDPSLLTNVKFSERTDLHPNSKRSMTEIQAKTFAAASTGGDVLGRARTGTGKTVAFLLPAIERLVQLGEFRQNKDYVRILIVSPTRELATQIGVEAEKLLTFHNELSVKVIFGGTNMNRDISMFKSRVPSILVATPGRLLDHMENTKVNGLRFGQDVMSKTSIVILDETDRLLDMGFRREIKKILAYLPRKEKRQTLLFSATIPNDLKPILKEQMRDDYVEVDCIHDGDGASHTNQRVNQKYVILPTMDSYLSSLVSIVRRSIDEDRQLHKIVVFFPTAMLVGFFAQFFNDALGINVIELHSKKSQSFRNKASEKFRNAKKGVLFTSDVSARGVDYPDVTQVIQFGLPDSREQYIHRLGRTGRAGKTGEGLLVLAPYEKKFLSELKDLDVPMDDSSAQLLANPPKDDLALVNTGVNCISKGDAALTSIAQKAYRAYLGYYTGQMKRTQMRSKTELVQTANNLFRLIGLRETPKLQKRTVGKMGLKGVPGISIR